MLVFISDSRRETLLKGVRLSCCREAWRGMRETLKPESRWCMIQCVSLKEVTELYDSGRRNVLRRPKPRYSIISLSSSGY
jgi:hypothetical protein